MESAIALFAFLATVVPLCGVVAALTPFLMPKRECFAVTVPETAHADPVIKGFKKSYALRCLVLTAACTAAVAAAFCTGLAAGFSEYAASLFSGVFIAATLVVTFVPFAFMLVFRRKVAALKQERGWGAARQTAAALVAEGDIPRAIPLAWNLLYLPVALAVAGIGIASWPSMPAMIPMHADFACNVTDFAPKSIGTVFGLPLAVIAFMAAAFTFSHWTIARSKRPVDPSAPVASALAYGMFVRAQSIFLLATGLIVSGAIGVSFMLATTGAIGLGESAAIILAACVPVTVGAIALALVYGQSGARLARRLQAAESSEEDSLPADDDRRWKLGVFYFNPDDSSLFLPKRFGIGWTVNFARPAVWACLAASGLAPVVLIAVISSLAA